MIKNKLSDIVANQLPQHITESYPTFVEFLQAYYKYLETQKVYRNLETVRDVETTLDTFIDLLKNEFAVEYPEFAKDRFFLKNTGHISVAHGSEESYKFLFRQMFKKEVDIRYPKDQILTLSNSLWVQDISFFVKLTSGDVSNLENNFIQIDTLVKRIKTKNRVYVKRVEFVETTTNTYEIFIAKDYYGSILVGDTISYNGVFATVIPTTVGIKIVKAGNGFSVGQVFNVESGTGSGLTFKITEVNLVGGIKSCQIINYGINYVSTFSFDLPSTAIFQDSVEIDGFKISSTSTQQRLFDSGIITKQNYYGNSYSNDYVGTVVADFSSLTVPSSIEINTARLQVNLGSVARYQGYYSNSTGLVSSPDSIIQDSYYYQDFSYVLRIDEAFETYRDIVLSLLHPTGRQMFAEYVIDNFYQLEYSIVEPIFKILLPIYSGVPDIAVMLDNLTYALEKFEKSDQLIRDSIAKEFSKPTGSGTVINDVYRWSFAALKGSSVTPTTSLKWVFAADKKSNTTPTDSLKYLLETSKSSSVTPNSAPSLSFSAVKGSTLSTPTSALSFSFGALKGSSVTPTSAPSFSFGSVKGSSVTPTSAPSLSFSAVKGSTLSTPTSASSFSFGSVKGSSVTPTSAPSLSFSAVKGSSVTPTSAPSFSFGALKGSTLSTPTSAPRFSFGALKGSSVAITDSLDLGFLFLRKFGLSSTIRNLLSYSEDFTQWLKSGLTNPTITNSTIVAAPNGAYTADSIIYPASAAGAAIVYNNFSGGVVNTLYSGSIYLKANGYNFVRVAFDNSAFAATLTGCVVDLNAGVITSTLNGSNCTINAAGNGWYRVTVTATSDADGGNYIFSIVTQNNAGDSTLTPNGTSGIYAWGAQVEVGGDTSVYQGVAASGVLVEAAAIRNLFTYSEQFDNESWAKINSTITANITTAPDRTITADKFQSIATSSSTKILNKVLTTKSGISYTMSIYAKAAEETKLVIRAGGVTTAWVGTSNPHFGSFDLTTVTATKSDYGASASIVSVGDGWYRCSVTTLPTSAIDTVTMQYVLRLNASYTSTAIGDGLYVWGAQLEEGSLLTTYQRIGNSATAAETLVVPIDFSTLNFGSLKNSASTATDTSFYSLSKLIAPAVNAYAAIQHEFTSASWTKTSVSVTANTIAAPDSSITADTIAENTSASSIQHRIIAPFATVIGNIYTTSFYLKAGTRNWAAIRFSEANTFDVAYFNLSTGTIGTVEAGLTARIENHGNGWYRCFVTRAATKTEMASGINIIVADNTFTHVGLGSEYYLYAWGADAREIDQVITTDTTALTTLKPIGYFDLNDVRRNLIRYSEQFDNWSLVNVSATANTITAPDGTITAEKIVEDTDVDVEHYVQITPNIATNQTYTQSVYVKAAEISRFRLMVVHIGASSNTSSALFTISAGVVTAGVFGGLVTSASVLSVGNGWYRCSITYTLNGTVTTHNQRIYPKDTGNYNGDGTSGIYLWGAQTEVGTITAYQGIVNNAVIKANSVRNLVAYSEQFNNSVWNKGNITVSVNATTSPDGTITAEKIVEAATTGQHIILQLVTTKQEGLIYVYSIYAKAAEWTTFQLQMGSGGPKGIFDLTAKTATTSLSAISASVTDVGNGWFRCSVVGISNDNQNIYVYKTPSLYDGDGVSGIYLWGAQLEILETLSEYQPTLATGVALNTATKRNLLTYSEEFDNSFWIKGGTSSITANTGIAPDLTTTADTLSGSTNITFGTTFRSTSIPCSAGLTYTGSIYIKTLTATTVKIRLRTGSDVGPDDTNTITPTSSWQRIFVTLPITVDNNNLTMLVGATDGDILIWGAQLEVGSQPSAYQRIGSNNAIDSLAFPLDTLNILTSRPVASLLSSPTDTTFVNTNKGLSSTQINTDSGNVYLNFYSSTIEYFVDISYLQASQSF